ncbi:MAG: hypothetical protein IJA55_01580 [Clostridia bacterium]|nr:hypothetical protein [Clostridia bacterium]
MANIDLITGFLGAGKTTFIRKYAQYLNSIGESYVVIENEYGNKGIDSMILEADGITTDELYGGCICCTLKVGFHDMLMSFADKVDRVIVEPSGVYDISQFYTVMSSESLNGKCEIGNVICVVDPTKLNVLDSLSLDMLHRQVVSSGAIVFSMDDDDRYIPTLNKLIGVSSNVVRYNDMQTLYKCGYKKTDLTAETTHTAEYLSTLVKPSPCDDIKKRIETLFATSEAGRILRVKGFWNGFLVNAVEGHIEVYKCSGDEGLNIIGLGISRKIITEVLNNGTIRKEDKR